MRNSKCELCGHGIGNEDYSFNEFMSEAKCLRDASYCDYCKLILRSRYKIRQKGVKINKSHFPLPGFVLPKDGKYYVRKRNCKKNSKVPK